MNIPHYAAQLILVTDPLPIPNASVWGILNMVLKVVVPLAGVGFVIMFVYAGFTYIMSAGDAQKVKGAQSMMSNALIGIIIIAMAFVIQRLVQKALGI